MAISVQKTIPSSNYYSGSGDTTVTLNGVEDLTIHSKKDLIKIRKPKTKSRQSSENSDEFDNSIVDLKRGTDEITIRGWLEDDASETAWNKFWKLRAMCSRGGALTALIIDNITFNSGTQEVFLEDITGVLKPDDSGALNTNYQDDRARINVSMQLFVGDER